MTLAARFLRLHAFEEAVSAALIPSYSEATEILQKGYGRSSALRTRIPQDSSGVEIVKLML
jgi:hypothetical protein